MLSLLLASTVTATPVAHDSASAAASYVELHVEGPAPDARFHVRREGAAESFECTRTCTRWLPHGDYVVEVDETAKTEPGRHKFVLAGGTRVSIEPKSKAVRSGGTALITIGVIFTTITVLAVAGASVNGSEGAAAGVGAVAVGGVLIGATFWIPGLAMWWGTSPSVSVRTPAHRSAPPVPEPSAGATSAGASLQWVW